MQNPVRNDNTILIIFGDHGQRAGPFRSSMQGKLEERLPFYSITTPQSFRRKHKELLENLKHNRFEKRCTIV